MNKRGFAPIIIFLAIVIVMIGAFAFYYTTQRPGASQTAGDAAVVPVPSEATSTAPADKCFEDLHYLVATRGSDILVKYKTTEGQALPCSYDAQGIDFELKGFEATYVVGLAGHFLVLDFGTAPPPRGLILYDLTTRTKSFSDKYSQPLDLGDTALRYWSPTSTKPTVAICPDLKSYLANGLGAEIEAHVVLNLETMKKTELGEYRCSATQ